MSSESPGDTSSSDAGGDVDAQEDTECEPQSITATGTTSAEYRWGYTNDVAAVAVLTVFPLLVGLSGTGVIRAESVPVNWRLTLVSVTLVATAWTFGPGAVETAIKIRNGGS